MSKILSNIRRCLLASLAALAMTVPMAAGAAPDDIVFVKVETSDAPLAFAQIEGEVGEVDIEAACHTLNSMLLPAAGAIPPSVQHHLFGREMTMGDLRPLALDCSEARPTTNSAVLVFSTCSMTMTDGIHTMYWTVPPDAPEAQMVIIDAKTRQHIDGVLLETELNLVGDAAKGREISQTVTPTSGRRDYEIELEIGPTGNYRITTETFTGRAYDFDYEGQIGLPGMQGVAFATPKLESDGTAWISPEVPGSDVVAMFYENFRNYVTSASGTGTLLTAMIEQMADVVQNGMPLETTQTIKSSMPYLGLAQGSTSTSKVVAITVWEGAAAEHDICGHVETPEGYTTVNMAEMSGMGAGGAQMDSEDMREMQEAMQQLTPEQRQAMEQFGMGDMLQQMMGGANPGASQAAGGAAAGAAAAGAAASRSGGSNMPPSEELNSGNLTESVERHLQALGYDVGDVDGEASLETTIAISTFQAEKGMAVTGEVSPQLLGILSAEVDSRR